VYRDTARWEGTLCAQARQDAGVVAGCGNCGLLADSTTKARGRSGTLPTGWASPGCSTDGPLASDANC